MSRTYTDADVSLLLERNGVAPTVQRVLITQTLLNSGAHLTAEDLFTTVNKESPGVSKATVYNTVGLLARKGVIREVIADPNKLFYDGNATPHHHFYDETTGELIDIDAKEVRVTGLPPLPDDAELKSVDIVVRVVRTPKK
jgi:Fur family transcriptional regulator, iron response regulator